MLVTSSFSTIVRPESGLRRPRASFRIVLLPEPATPNTALVSPIGTLKDTPRSTSFCPKLIQTSSKTMANPEFCRSSAGGESRDRGGVAMGSLIGKHVHEELSGEKIHHDDQHRGSHHSLRGCTADTLCPAPGRHAVKTSDGRDNKAE